MKHCLVTAAAIGGLVASTASWSKGDITKITVEHLVTHAVIEITDPEELDRFTIWSGPGVVSWDMAKTVPPPQGTAFIIDWTKGVLAAVPSTLATHKVTMYVDRYDPPCNKYEVLYRVDEGGTGYVYLPRWDEEIGRCNMSLIARDVEGNWFRSSQAWHDVAERFGVWTIATRWAASPPAGCAITTDPARNDELWAWSPGKLVFEPGGSGFVERDGALGIKWPFQRLKRGQLFVGGRRLDGAAGPARAYISDYGDSGFQPIYLVFPTPGCWEISAGVGAATKPLTFVVLVEKVGAGPAWFQDGAKGRRVTTHGRDESTAQLR